MIAAAYNNQLGYGYTYILMFIGQSLAALSQPTFLNMPPALASIWFPVKERDMSTTIASMFSPIGSALGELIPVIFVSQEQITDDDYAVHGMFDLMLAEFVICIIPIVLAIFFFKSSPPTPPSKSTKLKIDVIFFISYLLFLTFHRFLVLLILLISLISLF